MARSYCACEMVSPVTLQPVVRAASMANHPSHIRLQECDDAIRYRLGVLDSRFLLVGHRRVIDWGIQRGRKSRAGFQHQKELVEVVTEIVVSLNVSSTTGFGVAIDRM